MKYFVVSDIHSYFTELKRALDAKGFDARNPEHTLIVCGDIFDRGKETLEVFDFLSSLNKKRCILIKGNHESLLFELLKKDFPADYDFSNGTVSTCCQIANRDISAVDYSSVLFDVMLAKGGYGYSSNLNLANINSIVHEQLNRNWKEIVKKVKSHKIIKWLKGAQWVNYYELDKYIFVHSFIPVNCRLLDVRTPFYIYNPNWRKNSSSKDWENATWGCPYKLYDSGVFAQEEHAGKVLVCGHWTTRDFHLNYEVDDNDHTDDFSIYYGKHLIAIDACTALSKQVNVLVIDENYDIVK